MLSRTAAASELGVGAEASEEDEIRAAYKVRNFRQNYLFGTYLCQQNRTLPHFVDISFCQQFPPTKKHFPASETGYAMASGQ